MSELKSYKKIVGHYENCFREHGDTHKGMDWPNEEGANIRYQVMWELIRSPNGPRTLLDFGCGTGHFYQFLLDKKYLSEYPIIYEGVDLSEKFVTVAQNKFPDVSFRQLDIMERHSDLEEVDYTVLNGVFTEKRELAYEEMWGYFEKMLKVIFERNRVGIAFNVMSKAVDWERWDLFHVPLDPLVDFLTKELSRNFVVRNDYGLYEYTVYIYR